jgi:hypothetical protein
MAKFTSLEFNGSSYELKVNWFEGNPSYYDLKNGVTLEVVEDDITVTSGIVSNSSLFMVRSEKYFTARMSGGTDGDLKFGNTSYDPSNESNIYIGENQMLFAPNGFHVAIFGTDDMRYGRRSNCFYPLESTRAYIELKNVGSGSDYNVIFGFLITE